MRLLLDTHTFLWFVLNDPQLSQKALDSISDPKHQIFLSPASYWEIAIKINLGKYSLSVEFETFFQQGMASGIKILPVEIRHAAVFASLPMYHKDPFDRMIVSQALAEQLSLVSADLAFDLYGIPRIW